ncbi:glycosyltransferase [Heliobacterium gestii]|uniref:Glycogen synthase n=1 Tax=Heliomicrobium gestii TaxID=2699 RepID=A0A845LCV4_HELGE|nr:glycogen/starch synthase [Heliomicrobium gestii]MBM7868507.1 starch synthase [Heliomicrobium gestii]MZP44667.1 glycosyltransferase [Heliomicrobium gestii]
MTEQPLKVLFVSAEVVPFAKAGGLADVAGSLPRALNSLGVDARVAMPRHGQIPKGAYITDHLVEIDARKETAVIRAGRIEALPGGNAVPVYFIDNYQYFGRENIYGYGDDGDRWGFFSRAVMEMLEPIDFIPDILHFNDWQCGPAIALLKEEYRHHPAYRRIASVLTVHNLEYQGHFGRNSLRFIGLRDDLFRPGAVEFHGQVNYMKAGLVFADVINTVSRTYAEEIQTPEYGWGLDGLLRLRHNDLFGIVNGIDVEVYDPATDPHIPYHFSQENMEGKKRNKAELQRELGLPVSDAPLLGLVHRLVDQKGIDLFEGIEEALFEEDLQLAVVGQGDPRYEGLFRRLKQHFPEKVGLFIGFDSPLAQRVYAGSDFFLMPSRFEPCGLGQLIAFRYGAIPIVRSTGGLADTVTDVRFPNGNGLVFEAYAPEDFLDAIRRGLALYWQGRRWNELVAKVMGLDHSWRRSADEYLELYGRARRKVNLEV